MDHETKLMITTLEDRIKALSGELAAARRAAARLISDLEDRAAHLSTVAAAQSQTLADIELAFDNGTVTRSIRRRCNVSTSVKGVKTPDHTIETVGYTLAEQMGALHEQEDAMKAAWPVATEVK